jgi:2-polyprenyl-3-methyl-5-hydroxy-6-metoxy-1,4-benzoquinol methylase
VRQSVVRELPHPEPRLPVRVLDFGCGCGRVARHVAGEGILLHGVDWNRRAVRWCQRHLPQGTFVVGRLEPPLPLDLSVAFDAIYAFSVFTHLTEALQRAWLEELGARLEPGGALAVSTHGEGFVQHLSAEEHRSYREGALVVREPVAAGTNVCAAYHPPGSFERLVPETLVVSQHVPMGALGNPPQDLWLLRSARG